jgi:hypothetical protein
MQELLGILSIVSSLLVLALIWSTARPVRRPTRNMTMYGLAGTQASAVLRQEPETVQVVEVGATKVESKEVGAEVVKAEPGTGAKEAIKERPEGTEAKQGQQEESADLQGTGEGQALPQDVSPEADLEEEVVRELSETLSMYRQLLEELRRLRSGGSPE